MFIENIILLFGFLVFANSLLLNKKPFSGQFCNGCDKCSLGYTGGGVLLYKNNENDKEIILGIDYKNELTDFGGKINYSGEKVWEIASRELYEESNGIFQIDKNIIGENDYVDIDRINHKYRCYFIPIENYEINKFHENKKMFFQTNSFKEIVDIISVQEKVLKNIITNKSDYLVNSPDIIPFILSPRLKKILSIYFEKN